MEHLDDETIESIARAQLREPTLGSAEEHLLVCTRCRTRLSEEEEYIHALRRAFQASKTEGAEIH